MNRVLALALSCAALLLNISIPSAMAQGVAATAKSAAKDPTEEIRQLRSAVEILTQRVQELEKQRSDLLTDKAAEAAEKAADETRAARVEQRLAKLETARPGSGAQETKSEVDGEQPLTVTAPFVVKDRNGKAIMVVQEDSVPKLDSTVRAVPGGSRGLYVYGPDPGAALAHMGVTRDRRFGRIYVASASLPRPNVVITTDANGPYVVLNNATDGKIAALDKSGFAFFNPAGYPIGEIRSKDGRGVLLINAADGSHMVEAGALATGKGYVLANPYQPSTAVSGDPSVLMGGKKK